MKSSKLSLIVIAFFVFLTACGGGGGGATESSTSTDGGTGTTTDSGSGSGSGGTTTTTLVTTTCTPAPALPSRYARVFKGCDSAGVAQYYDITECVRDNTTGLIWQGQAPAGSGLRANDKLYTNYDSTSGNQNWNGGSPIPVTVDQINQADNSIGFKNAVNAASLCGFTNWRMPSWTELSGLIKTTGSPAIDTAWFPNTSPNWYWTSDPDPGGNPSYAYLRHFGDRGTGNLFRRGPHYVRLVR